MDRYCFLFLGSIIFKANQGAFNTMDNFDKSNIKRVVELNIIEPTEPIGIRTQDIMIKNHVLCQLSYRPIE